MRNWILSAVTVATFLSVIAIALQLFLTTKSLSIALPFRLDDDSAVILREMSLIETGSDTARGLDVGESSEAESWSIPVSGKETQQTPDYNHYNQQIDNRVGTDGPSRYFLF